MRPSLRLRQLEALKAVSDHGSMTRAAQELGISQPAVSRLLADLSTGLGFDLFDRRQGRLALTQEARVMMPDINRLLEMMTHISDLGRNLTERKAGHLRIACLPGFATSHLPGVLARFLADRPGVTATLEPDRPERILEWIIGEQYDCGITDGFDGHPAVDSETVAIRSVCILPAGHRLLARDRISPADLHEVPLIHTRRDSTFFRELSEAFAAEGAAMTPIVETRQFTAACEMVAARVGVSVVSELDAAGYGGAGLDYRPFVPGVPHRLALVRPVHKRPSMVTLEFMDMFRESLRPFEVLPVQTQA
ncbi:LysR family transcriptional regulator [Meridianimarinicoccus roseus]|jgi:DNA-binding transcriptional LysR family regulator|uniref:LysR family transcriptional regulator n=1 Tax=Meridianimarinicoccus roseus TaxID=2072018 RepID=A0A2V2LMQ5_9RHOB|nr:LysR substrate-binding domain-containing protein [Meridianimarinicoccus roseus]PWR04486.1 LysR family transcriptional regulator [Meridianimarinicoccus roseus]